MEPGLLLWPIYLRLRLAHKKCECL
jgi:hypothetical protein